MWHCTCEADVHVQVYVYVYTNILYSCVDKVTELMSSLEGNPTIEFSTLIRDEEENFKVSSSVLLHVPYVRILLQ